MMTIKDLHFYPIKSLRGIRVPTLDLTPEGPRWDREWALIDENRKVLTQRQMPLLARIGVRMDDVEIEISTSDLGPMSFGLEERDGDSFPITIWKDEFPAFEVSSEVSAWASEATGQEVKLVRLSPEARREFRPETLPGRTVRLVDAYPLLVISLASLQDLEKRAGITFSMSRFRPNIVVDGAEAYGEDAWGGFKVGAIQFQGIKPCGRCKVTTVHPLTGEVGEEPLKTLMTYRRAEKGVVFGYYYAHLNEGRLAVGDSLTIG